MWPWSTIVIHICCAANSLENILPTTLLIILDFCTENRAWTIWSIWILLSSGNRASSWCMNRDLLGVFCRFPTFCSSSFKISRPREKGLYWIHSRNGMKGSLKASNYLSCNYSENKASTNAACILQPAIRSILWSAPDNLIKTIFEEKERWKNPKCGK